MEALFIIAVVGGIIALIVFLIRYAAKVEAKRKAGLLELGTQLGFDFVPKAPFNPVEVYADFGFFKRGHSRRSSNFLIQKNDGRTIHLFDYKFTTGSGKNSTTHWYSVFVMQIPGMNLPQFQLSPEGFFDRVGKFFGGQDINFDSQSEFSDAYRLKGDEASIRQYFDQDLLDFFARNQKWNVEGKGDLLLIYGTSRYKVEQTQEFLTKALAIAAEFSSRA